MYFGLQCGLDYAQAMALPVTRILDLVAVQAIEKGGAERKLTGQDAARGFEIMAKMK